MCKGRPRASIAFFGVIEAMQMRMQMKTTLDASRLP
jgi:hypothetical protein